MHTGPAFNVPACVHFKNNHLLLLHDYLKGDLGLFEGMCNCYFSVLSMAEF